MVKINRNSSEILVWSVLEAGLSRSLPSVSLRWRDSMGMEFGFH